MLGMLLIVKFEYKCTVTKTKQNKKLNTNSLTHNIINTKIQNEIIPPASIRIKNYISY